MLIRLVISLTADQCAKGAAMLLDVSNPACSLRESPCWSFLLGLTPLTADTKRSWAHWWCALHWGLLKQTAMQPVHTRSISSVSLIMLCFPGRENLNFQMLSATSQGYLKNNWQGQTSMPILSDLSAAAAIGHGCFWYVCSCLCEGLELHDWLVSFLLSERTQMAVLGDRSHAPRTVSLLMSPNSSIVSLLPFSQRKQFQGLHNPLWKGEHCSACLAYLAPGAWASDISRKCGEAQGLSHYWPQSCKFQPRISGDATIIQTHSITRDHFLTAALERCSKEVTLQNDSSGYKQVGSGPFFLMGKGCKWRNL